MNELPSPSPDIQRAHDSSSDENISNAVPKRSSSSSASSASSSSSARKLSQRQQKPMANVNDETSTALNTPSTTSPIPSGHLELPAGRTPMAAYNEERMRRRLQFFFMNPIEKWQAKRRFPYKFFVQVVKIILVTMQLCLFAHSRYNHVNYTQDNRVTFSHLFLRGWDTNMEVSTYPPGSGPLSLYAKEDFYETIDFAIAGYANLSRAIGPYSYPDEHNHIVPMRFCLYEYAEGAIFGFNESYVFNPEIDSTCMNLTNNSTESTKQFFTRKSVTINFAALVRATLEFGIKTVNFKAAGPIAPPDCYQFNICILFDNSDHDGQMLLSLDAEPIRLHCKGNVEYITESEIDAALRSILNMFVIVICLLSFALCARAIYRAQILKTATETFFRHTYGRPLTWDERMEFLNIWYIMIICNDVLLVVGSAMKEQIERKHFTANEWNTCSIFLGVGNLLVWFGVLRYLGFFKTYNVVILTLKRAAPKISRFLICALLIYAGFTFCGWLVLGPYHDKFRSLATTSECLFSLINGDDMYATFSMMSEKSLMLWLFSRIYLYSFISLYIYVVLSLFISVIMDAYDTIKKYYKEGFPLSDLKQFIGPMDPLDFESGAYRDNDGDEIRLVTGENEPDESCINDVLGNLAAVACCCRARRTTDGQGPTGYTSLTPKNDP